MMFADLPPSSWVTRFTVGAALIATCTPARVDPVKETMSMPGCEAIAAPTVGPSPFTRLKTPGGTPASCRISVKRIAFNGATSVGFSTMVQPAASAGATLQAIWLIGQFHGVIIPTTPTGSRTIIVRPLASSNSNVFSTASAWAKWPTPAAACAAFDSHIGAPTSVEIVVASSSCLVLNTRMMFSSSAMRSSRVVRE